MAGSEIGLNILHTHCGEPDTHSGTLAQRAIDGDFIVAPTTPSDAASMFSLSVTSPNRTGRSTAIRYQLPWPSAIDLSVYDVAGRRIRTIESAKRSAGPHTVTWDGRDGAGLRVPSGIYFLRLATGTSSVNRRLILIP
jgi:flagellar hook assembly protein FlgD